MKCLFIDTSGSYLTVALINDNDISVKYIGDVPLKHSINLMTEVENLLLKNGLSVGEVDVYSCVIGPGSFTGIRIGISTTLALSYANGKKILPVTSFSLLAYNKTVDKKLAVISAGHNNFYVEGFDGDKSVLPPSFIDISELKRLAEEYTVFSQTEIDGVNATVVTPYQNILSVVTKNIDKATLDIKSIVPLYVKKSQAEENAK